MEHVGAIEQSRNLYLALIGWNAITVYAQPIGGTPQPIRISRFPYDNAHTTSWPIRDSHTNHDR